MSKAVLLSIRPEWCSRIFSGWKTVEIRKTRPVSLKEPFKCYIYCTKGTKFFSTAGLTEWLSANLSAMTSDALALNTVSSKKILNLQLLEAVSQYRKSKTMPDGSPG